jgi:serine/threonine protein kinase
VLYHTQRLSREKQALETRLAGIAPAGLTPALELSPQDARTVSDGDVPAKAAVARELKQYILTPHSAGKVASGPAAGADSPPPIPDHTLLKRIGEGAYGEVWVARSVVGSFHAAKIVYRTNFREDRPYEREFDGIRRYEPISRSHPGLLHILHVGRNQEAGYYYCLMELADDLERGTEINFDTYQPRSLTAELKKRRQFPLADCLQVGLNLSDALGYLHDKNLIHRDIKPANIVFVGGKPKLADIGLVTGIGDSVTFVGTEGFYPPEGPGSPAADIFSLGKVLYEIATGLSRNKFPDLPSGFFEGPDQDRLRTLNKIIMKACDPDVTQRYQSAKQLHADLLTLQQ